MSSNGRANRADLVFEGGGVKGIGLAGAFSVLAEQGWEPMNLAGTSAGAITAALVAAGYAADELREEIVGLDFKQFEDESWEDRLPVIEKTASLLKDLGVYEGRFFQSWMAEKLAVKGKRTFGDLVVDPKEDDLRYRYKLHVVASDVSEHRLLVLPRDAAVLGLDPDELEIAYAVRMSMSMPFFFEPVEHLNPRTNRVHTIVDGGMLSNFPVWLFDCPPGEEPAWPTFGLLLVEANHRASVGERLSAPERARARRGAGGLVSYVKALAQTTMEFHDRLYVEKADFARTIPIDTIGVRTTEFDLPRERALALYESGRKAAEAFLENWDFEAYITAFRSGRKIAGRRHEIASELRTQVDTLH
jgi:NTE family protein